MVEKYYFDEKERKYMNMLVNLANVIGIRFSRGGNLRRPHITLDETEYTPGDVGILVGDVFDLQLSTTIISKLFDMHSAFRYNNLKCPKNEASYNIILAYYFYLKKERINIIEYKTETS